MVRRGWLERGPGPDARRGLDGYVPMEWDEVLDRLAAELRRVQQQHGCEAIFGGSYGWSSAGRFHHAQSQVHRFLNTSLGGYVRSVNSYSAGASGPILPHVIGTMEEVARRNVTWEQIVEHTWNDRVVASGSLNQVVFSLRNLLNDSRDHDILMTIPRRGYRFNPLYVRNAANAETAPTAIEPEPLTAPVAAPIKQPPNWLRLGYAFTLLMCLATLAHFSLSATPPSIEVASNQRGNLTLSTLGSTQDQAQALGSAVDKQLHNLPRDLAGQVWIHQSKSNYSISCIRTDQTTRNLLFNPRQRQLADVLARIEPYHHAA